LIEFVEFTAYHSTSAESSFDEDPLYHYWLITIVNLITYFMVMSDLNLKRKCDSGTEKVRNKKLKSLVEDEAKCRNQKSTRFI